MSDKAILFDASRCTACGACAQACKERAGLPWGTVEGNEAVADAYQRAADLDGLSPLVITLTEREAAGQGMVWEVARKGCVRCAEAPCAQVCPTGSLTLDEAAGLTGPVAERCVSCGLCAMVCPVAAPRSADERGAVCLCDGCPDRVANGGKPACVAVCPTDALMFGSRDEMMAAAHDRAAVLRDRGYDRASVLGESEQGGHFVVQVLKYGVEGNGNEPFATTEDIPWIAGAKMAGPVSLGVLGIGTAGAAVALAVEANKARRERSEAMRVPVNAYGGVTGAGVEEGVPSSDAREAAEMATETATVGAVADGAAASGALEAALRKREAMRARTAATPAAAAAAAAAARGEGPQLIPVAFTADEDGADEEGFESGESFDNVEGAEDFPEVDGFGETEGFEGFDGADDPDGVFELAANDKEDTGELYDLEEFQRLLKADILAHHAAKIESRAAAAETDGENTAEGEGVSEEVEPTGNAKSDGAAEAVVSDGSAPARVTGADADKADADKVDADKADAVDSADGQA